MNKIVKSIASSPFFAGSIVMVVGANLFNAGQFFYHFLTARFLQIIYGESLGKAYYGDVAAIISLLGVISIIQLSLGLTVVKFIASQKNEKSVSNLAKWVYHWTTWLGIGLGVSLFLISPFLASFLNITQASAFLLTGPILGFYLIISTGRSILQGVIKFNKYVLSLLSEVGLKLVFTSVLILAGFAVFGAIMAIFLGTLAAFLVTRLALNPYLKGKRGRRPDIAPLLKYSLPVFVQGLALTSMYSVDLLLVKHFFSPQEAGLYAGLAVLGRIVFFGASPVTNVMFPLVARRHSHGETYHNIFYISFFVVLGIASLVTLFYYFAPQLPILLLYGRGFLEGKQLLWWFGLFMGLLALSMLLTQFYLSIGKTKAIWPFAIAAVLQIVLIWVFHPSLLTVIQISIISVTLSTFSLILYFPFHHKW